MSASDRLYIAGETIALGERRNLKLPISQSYAGAARMLPFAVWRAENPGPTVFVSAAVHGDELNGTGVVRELLLRPPFELASGTLILVPVVNVLGFERQSRYLPDRRDLNRSFPGDPQGSLARRFAHAVMTEIVDVCDFGVDLHTGAVRRTNYPNVRADLNNPGCRRIADAFGCECIVHGHGPRGSLRRSACRAGCPTIILEAGEVWKIEPAVVEHGLRGVRNVLIELGMIGGVPVQPPYRAYVRDTHWVRSNAGGILEFHVAPGEIVEAGQPLATCSDILGREQHAIVSTEDALILGMTTLPAITPGEPICHLAIPDGGIGPIRKALGKLSNKSLPMRLRDDLATNLAVSDPPEDGEPLPDTG